MLGCYLMINNNTPIEKYILSTGEPVLIKREDMSIEPPAPPFSKMRGVMAHLIKLKASGTTVVGYTETSISMAGWGIAWACKELGMKAVIFDPQYKAGNELPLLTIHRGKWKENGADIIPIPAGRAKVGYYLSRKILWDKYGYKAIMLPLGVPFAESVEETAQETLRTIQSYPDIKTIVVVVGSGTIAAGVWKGVKYSGERIVIYGIMCRTGNMALKHETIKKKAALPLERLLRKEKSIFTLFDPKWEYTQPCEIPEPFPCHPYYDLKAWDWLERNIKILERPVLFWNVGAMAKGG